MRLRPSHRPTLPRRNRPRRNSRPACFSRSARRQDRKDPDLRLDSSDLSLAPGGCEHSYRGFLVGYGRFTTDEEYFQTLSGLVLLRCGSSWRSTPADWCDLPARTCVHRKPLLGVDHSPVPTYFLLCRRGRLVSADPCDVTVVVIGAVGYETFTSISRGFTSSFFSNSIVRMPLWNLASTESVRTNSGRVN